ncbi:MAG: Swt1 family HEPN domain-containing protein [Candidatus Krumholzibacteriia bacterium]
MNSKQYDQLVSDLRAFLSRKLPTLSDRWWPDLVLPNISDKFKRRFGKAGPTAFKFLDLGDLLKLTENIWYLLEEKHQYPQTALGLVKQLRIARNEYAHRSTIDPMADEWDRYHALTIEMLLRTLNSGVYQEWEQCGA